MEVYPKRKQDTPTGYFAERKCVVQTFPVTARMKAASAQNRMRTAAGKDRRRMTGNNTERKSEIECSCCCHQKATPRDERELKQLKNRLNRMAGQLNGIGKMLDENRYCGDILTQVAAVESALQAFGYLILQEHMKTCVVEEIQKGNAAVVEEAVELVKKLK